tara:strand:- start:7132 stop:7701 length:570 start_codon:yes stop_codon:yes gene_type:complete
MKEFAFFFISVIIIFMIIQKIDKDKDILEITSEIDNRIYIVRKLPDGKEAADRLAKINKNIITLLDSLNEKDRDGIATLKKRFNPDKLSETGLGAKYTSYSVNKGEEIAICVRQPNNTFIDDNTVMFVVIHELAHVMTKSVGHTTEFWDNMAYLLERGEELGIYNPKNYKEHPVDYCGMEINTTPYKKF